MSTRYLAPIIAMPYVGLLTDRSITLDGNVDVLVQQNLNRAYLYLFNAALHPIYVNPTGGTPSAGGLGTVTIQPGESWPPYGSVVPQNAVNVLGTSGDVLCAFEA